MLERPDSGKKSILVHIDFSQERDQEDLEEFQISEWSAAAKMACASCLKCSFISLNHIASFLFQEIHADEQIEEDSSSEKL